MPLTLLSGDLPSAWWVRGRLQVGQRKTVCFSLAVRCWRTGSSWCAWIAALLGRAITATVNALTAGALTVAAGITLAPGVGPVGWGLWHATAAEREGVEVAPCACVFAVGLAMLWAGWHLASVTASALLRAGSETR